VRRLPLSPTAVWSVVKELRASAEDLRPLLVGGAPEPARVIRGALVAGGDPDAVRDVSGRRPTAYDFDGAAMLVYAIAGGMVRDEDEAVLGLASRRGVEVVCVLVGLEEGDLPTVPHVLDTDLVGVRPGEELPFETILERVADRAGDDGLQLGARLPALRPAVVEGIIRRFSVQNGVLGVVVFIPGADFPVLTLNQIRMVLRIAAAYGEEIDRERALEVLSVVAAGLGFRTLARQLVGAVPGFGWAVKGGVAYAATRGLGEAADAYFAAGGTRMLTGSVRSRS
jgi:uncharacterized protein (DUF697 family)